MLQTDVLPPSEMGLCRAAVHWERAGGASPCPLQKPGFVAGVGAEQAGIHPKAVGTGPITGCSLDSWTAENSHSSVFQVLSQWSDIKLVKGFSLAEARPVVTARRHLSGGFPCCWADFAPSPWQAQRATSSRPRCCRAPAPGCRTHCTALFLAREKGALHFGV